MVEKTVAQHTPGPDFLKHLVMRHLLKLAILAALIYAAVTLDAGPVDEFDPEHWLAEMDLVCASLERGAECAR